MKTLVISAVVSVLFFSTALASDISARLVRDPVAGISLNSDVFASAMVGLLTGDFTAGQIRTFLNDHLADNQSTDLTASEENDIVGGTPSIKSHYDALSTDVLRNQYLHKIRAYSNELQRGNITEATWDSKVGL